jgi:hypothetical protein
MAPPFLSLLALVEGVVVVSTLYPVAPVACYKQSKFLGPIEMEIERAANTGGGTVWSATLNGLANANRQDFKTDGASTIYDTAIAFVALANNNWLIRIDKSTRTGTATIAPNSKTITGAGTAFLTELKVGSEVVINGEKRTIQVITSATVATVDQNFTTTAAGAAITMIDDFLVPTTDFSLSSNGGLCRVTLAAAAKGPNNATMQVHFVVPVALFAYATATITFLMRELPSSGDALWYATDATASPSNTNIYIRSIGL